MSNILVHFSLFRWLESWLSGSSQIYSPRSNLLQPLRGPPVKCWTCSDCAETCSLPVHTVSLERWVRPAVWNKLGHHGEVHGLHREVHAWLQGLHGKVQGSGRFCKASRNWHCVCCFVDCHLLLHQWLQRTHLYRIYTVVIVKEWCQWLLYLCQCLIRSRTRKYLLINVWD